MVLKPSRYKVIFPGLSMFQNRYIEGSIRLLLKWARLEFSISGYKSIS